MNTRGAMVIGLIGLCLTIGAAWGQTNVPTTGTREWSGRVLLPPDRILLTPDQPTTADSLNTKTLLERPTRPERPNLPPEVLERIRRFKQDAQQYMDQQEVLKRRLLGATDQERARIREQMDNHRREWLRRARELRQEFKERQEELLLKLPGHREILEGAREAAREQLRGQVRDVKDRGGQD